MAKYFVWICFRKSDSWPKKRSVNVNRNVTRAFNPEKYDVISLYKSYTELYHCNIYLLSALFSTRVVQSKIILKQKRDFSEKSNATGMKARRQ